MPAMNDAAAPTIPCRTALMPRITDAVRALVAERGLRFSMDAVAARAGCSKQTLYSHVGSKQTLMHAVVTERLEHLQANLDPSQGDLRDQLLAFAKAHLENTIDPQAIAGRRLLLVETKAFAEQSSILFQNAINGLLKQLRNRLAIAMRDGQLRQADPGAAAELFLGMTVALELDRAHFGVAQRADDTARSDWVEFAVDAFLRAFS